MTQTVSYSNDDEAAQAWLGVLRDGTDAQKIQAREHLAAIFERRGMLEEAIDLLVANARAGVRNADIFRRLARLYREQGDEMLSTQAAAEAVKYMPPATTETVVYAEPAPSQSPTVRPGHRSAVPGFLVWLLLATIGGVALILWIGSTAPPESARAATGGSSSSKTSADQGVVLRHKPGENPLRGGPYQFGGGTYRIEWQATDVTPREPCGHFVWVEPSGRAGLAGATMAARGEVPAGTSFSGSATKYLTGGSYDVIVMSGCGEWTVTVRRE